MEIYEKYIAVDIPIWGHSKPEYRYGSVMLKLIKQVEKENPDYEFVQIVNENTSWDYIIMKLKNTREKKLERILKDE